MLALAVPAFAGSANDPVSGLPLAPGMTPSNEARSITRKPPSSLRPRPAPLGQPIAGHVFSPDGTKGVNLTGTPKSDKVFSVMYLNLKTGLTEHQWTAFSPSNPSCK